MNYKKLIIIFLFLSSCSTNNINKFEDKKKVPMQVYSNKGFALLYKDNLKKSRLLNKKIDERSLIIFQKNLKKNTSVKITNLLNNKSVLAIVGKNSKYPSFYNSVISKRIAETLELDLNEPYIVITLISKNSTFIAKKSKTFEEEKEVAEKAPVDGIKISNLNNNISTVKKNLKI